METHGLTGKSIFLDEASVTATENAVMAAVLARGTTVLKHAASEPHVQDLCRLLVAMGAQIDGIGSNVLTIHGVDQLHGCTYSIVPDHHEAATFAVAAAVTHGKMRILNVVPDHLEMICIYLERMGVDFNIHGTEMHVHPSDLHAPQNIRSMRKIATNIWPGFPTDLASPFIVLATQAEGTTLVHDWMFEGRMFFVDKLIGMGANIVLCDPHRCVVTGRTPLRGRELQSPDIRAGVALMIAALCAESTSEISNVELVQRGYENIVERLSALGAKLEWIGQPSSFVPLVKEPVKTVVRS
jgi:UDP-N-acetylglucosamine 1-carboxyvinyltransferase